MTEDPQDMLGGLVDRALDALTTGTKPIRIFLFGGALLAFLVMTVLGKVFGVSMAGGDFDWPKIVLMATSLLSGFGITYAIVHYADAIKRKRAGGD